MADCAAPTKAVPTAAKLNLAPNPKLSICDLAFPRPALNSPASRPRRTANLEIIAIIYP